MDNSNVKSWRSIIAVIVIMNRSDLVYSTVYALRTDGFSYNFEVEKSASQKSSF